MSSPIRPRLTFATLMRRFWRNQRGVAAVQFAFIAPLFFCLLFAIIEVALIFFAGQTLETATQDTARLILTGQAQDAGDTQTTFKNSLCGNIIALFNCQSGIYIDVKSYSSFSSIPNPLPAPIDGSGNFSTSGFTYSPGNPGDVVVVRVFYQWPIFVSTLGFNVANLTGGLYLLSSAAVFRNEPYS